MSMSLVVNPFAFISAPVEEGINPHFEILAPRVGSSLYASRVYNSVEPELYSAFAEVSHKGANASLGDHETACLRAMGILVPPERVPKWPRFSCRLKPSASTGFALGTSNEHLGVRSSVPSAEVEDSFTKQVYFFRPPSLLVADAVTGLSFPYWTSSKDEFTPNDLRITGIDKQLQLAFIHASTTCASSDLPRARELWRQKLLASRRQFLDEGYTHVSGAIPTRQLAALRRYFGALVAGGFLEFDPKQGRFYKYNHVVGRLFLHLLQPLMSELAATEVIPSFTFLSANRRGALLPKHTDREQCEFTFSLLVDFEPRSEDFLGWPITIELPSTSGEPRSVTLDQRIGDLLVFRGRVLPHYRPRFGSATQAIHMTFHYVDGDFQGSLD